VTTNRFFAGALLASLATMVVVAGCYKPTIQPGGLRCNEIYQEECPDGYYCLDGRCQKTGAPVVLFDGGPDKAETKVDTGVDKGVDTAPPPPDASAEMMCYAPVAGCTPAAGKCDPLCQTGCGCREKCSVNAGGTLTCNALGGNGSRKEGQGCDFFNEGAASQTQTDNCEPGLSCFHDTCADLCVRFCRANTDCPNGALCNRTLPGGQKACSFSAMDCNPIKMAGPTGCPGAIQGCYLSATIKDRTVCDCSTLALGENASCTVSRDCFAGLACVDATGSGIDFRCRRVCSLTGVTNGGCPVGFTCRPQLDSQKYGYCN
jgi:hypothetical protein